MNNGGRAGVWASVRDVLRISQALETPSQEESGPDVSLSDNKQGGDEEGGDEEGGDQEGGDEEGGDEDYSWTHG